MIVSAKTLDAERLTQIALKSKSYWKYSKEQINLWKEDLTILLDDIKKAEVFIFKEENSIVGFYLLKETEPSILSLEFLFILPEFIGKNIGQKLLQHAIELSKKKNGSVLKVLSDPNAETFYAKYGFKTIDKEESSIAGRFLPKMELELSNIK